MRNNDRNDEIGRLKAEIEDLKAQIEQLTAERDLARTCSAAWKEGARLFRLQRAQLGALVDRLKRGDRPSRGGWPSQAGRPNRGDR